jgi:ferredoxin
MPSKTAIKPGNKVILEGGVLDALVSELKKQGYEVVGPKLSDGAIVYRELKSSSDLPVGWTDRQKPGSYRVEKRDDQKMFGYVVGPHSWKKFLHPPVIKLWSSEITGRKPTYSGNGDEVPKYAFLGVRPCEVQAMMIQDRVFLEGEYVDPIYKARRDRAFIVAVNCTEPGENCFCASVGSGPQTGSGFDLSLTEVMEGSRHYFLVDVGSEKGAAAVEKVGCESSPPEARETAAALLKQAALSMGRELETEGIRDLLRANYDHLRWEETAKLCMFCTICTMVCPTCFCTTVEDMTDLSGTKAERLRKWDSCFTLAFSYIHGGSVRASGRARYRQWMTHKLSTWQDQFESLGCVGCGRCITWCPVGIDITEEARAIRETRRVSK